MSRPRIEPSNSRRGIQSVTAMPTCSKKLAVLPTTRRLYSTLRVVCLRKETENRFAGRGKKIKKFDAVLFDRIHQNFEGIGCLHLQSIFLYWKWIQRVPPNRWYLCTKLYGFKNRVSLVVTLETCIGEMPSSNLGRTPVILTHVFSGFTQSNPPEKFQDSFFINLISTVLCTTIHQPKSLKF
jgi:hypothetical protein